MRVGLGRCIGKESRIMTEHNYNVIMPERGVPIKAWTRGVGVEEAAEKQLRNVASHPSFVSRCDF